MPEQIDSSPPNQMPAGKTHDLPHPLTVPGAIAVNMAMLADRFRIEGTPQPPDKGVMKKVPAILTEQVPLHTKSLKFGFLRFEAVPFTVPPMVSPAIDGGKQSEHLEVLPFLPGQCRFLRGGGVHVVSLEGKVREGLDWSQTSHSFPRDRPSSRDFSLLYSPALMAPRSNFFFRIISCFSKSSPPVGPA